jgi:glycosyltransferase involved in cell wall biosynthesis
MSASLTPLITFGIPAYDRPALLAETLASIAAQTAAVPYEVIVCDDGALPETAATVARFPDDKFFYHRNAPTLGPVRNWNEVIRRARGTWVMVLHEDDTLYPWYLAAVLPHLRDDLAAICTRTISGATPPALATPSLNTSALPYPPGFFLKSSMTPFPGVLIRRDLARQLGGFRESAGPLADYEFWYRLACAGRIEVVRTVAAFYRVADGQWTERAWPTMIRQTHLLRLRIAREQFPQKPRLGRWLARFFTHRNALSYAARFPQKPASLTRALQATRAAKEAELAPVLQTYIASVRSFNQGAQLRNYPGSPFIIQSLLRVQERTVKAAYLSRGFVVESRIHRDAWATLVLRRKGQSVASPA